MAVSESLVVDLSARTYVTNICLSVSTLLDGFEVYVIDSSSPMGSETLACCTCALAESDCKMLRVNCRPSFYHSQAIFACSRLQSLICIDTFDRDDPRKSNDLLDDTVADTRCRFH